MRVAGLVVLILSAVVVAACSSQQLYGAGQQWQRNECYKINEAQERQRCLSSTSTSYDDYKRQSEAAKGAR